MLNQYMHDDFASSTSTQRCTAVPQLLLYIPATVPLMANLWAIEWVIFTSHWYLNTLNNPTQSLPCACCCCFCSLPTLYRSIAMAVRLTLIGVQRSLKVLSPAPWPSMAHVIRQSQSPTAPVSSPRAPSPSASAITPSKGAANQSTAAATALASAATSRSLSAPNYLTLALPFATAHIPCKRGTPGTLLLLITRCVVWRLCGNGITQEWVMPCRLASSCACIGPPGCILASNQRVKGSRSISDKRSAGCKMQQLA